MRAYTILFPMWTSHRTDAFTHRSGHATFGNIIDTANCDYGCCFDRCDYDGDDDDADYDDDDDDDDDDDCDYGYDYDKGGCDDGHAD